MFNQARKLFERTLVGDSVPALVRWGKRVSPSVHREDSDDAFGEVVRYAAEHQKFFARKLRRARH